MTIFPAKLLLFGEYSILLGSSALSMPFHYFAASLKFINHENGDSLSVAMESNQLLQRMCDHFLANPLIFEKILDLNSLNRDIRNGLYLSSTIPMRYGMGSSGALCAAVYDHYKAEPHDTTRLTDIHGLVSLRNSFIQMESFFHGKSSGFDPLVSWLKTPLRLGTDGELVEVDFHGRMINDSRLAVLLVDSGQPCSTGPLVTDFLIEFAPDGIITSKGAALCTLVNSAIKKIPGSDTDALWDDIGLLSRFQLTHLIHLVPPGLISLWAHGLQTGLYILKLCGSGGGGFLLCFTRNKEKTIDYLVDRKIPFIPVPFS